MRAVQKNDITLQSLTRFRQLRICTSADFLKPALQSVRMKKILVVLVCIFGLSSIGNAQSSSVALRVGIPFLFSVGYGYDTQSDLRGFGVRGYLGATSFGFGGIVGLGIEGLMRTRVGFSGSSAYLGLGAALVASFTNGIATPVSGVPVGSTGISPSVSGYIYFLMGFEIALDQNWGLLLEMQPIAANISNQGFSPLTFPLISMGIAYRF